MKRTILFAAALLALAACKQQPASVGPVECGPYTVDVITDGVYHIQDFCAANPAGETFDETGAKTHFNNCSDMYLICGSEKALLIDLSNRLQVEGAADSLRALVSERIGDLPLTITFTHNHGDHTGMIAAYADDPDVEFALPRVDFEPFAERLELAGQICFYDRMDFCLGGKTVSSLLVPGHTAGSVVFFLKDENILFSGDAIGSGHGVWLFNSAAFAQYNEAVPQLISYIEDPANGIDTASLRIYGGHYWQRDWLDLDGELGYQYILDMQALLDEMSRGEAYTEPSNLGRPGLDTYFRHGNAIITWSADQCAEFFAQQ